MAIPYPPVGFHFKVEVLNLPASQDDDVRFTEVAGLSAELLTEEYAEGGENRFVQKYPTRVKYPELVLKRGLLVKSGVFAWILRNFDRDQVEPRNVDVTLLDENHSSLITWHLVGAYPTKWSVSDLNASANSVVVETLQLYYQYFTQDRAV